MAGSYGHLTDNAGDDIHPRIADDGRLDMELLENMGDMAEAVEELFGMVWWLAVGDPRRILAARDNYRAGLDMAGLIPYGPEPRPL